MYHYELRYFYSRKKQGTVYVSSEMSLNDFADEDIFLRHLVDTGKLDAGLADQIVMIRAVTEGVNDASSGQTDSYKYRCLFCRSEEFIRNPDGTLVCSGCGETYQELPEYRPIRLPRGIFRIVSGRNTLLLQKKGYGYSHECNGYTVLSNGTRAFAVSDEDYDRYYENKWAFCL